MNLERVMKYKKICLKKYKYNYYFYFYFYFNHYRIIGFDYFNLNLFIF